MFTSIQIGKIFGIPIKLHITFLFILPIFAFVFARNNAPYGFADQSTSLLNYILSLTTTILLFMCVLLHELGHSYVAKNYGVEIKDITLMLIGGVSSMEEIPRNPTQELKIAFAGPLVSIVIGIILLVINFFLVNFIPNYLDSIIYMIFNILASINIVLGCFNLIPAFPMDGGRVLRAWFATRMNNYVMATNYAAAIGKFLAILMGIIGIFYNTWLILIAFFVYTGASEEEKATTIAVSLERYIVKDIMSKNVISVPSDMSIENLLQFMFEHRHMGYPVIDKYELKGMVTLSDLQKVSPIERAAFQVKDLMSTNIISIQENSKAEEAFKLISMNNIGRVIVLNSEGQVSGIVSRTDLVTSITLFNEQLSLNEGK